MRAQALSPSSSARVVARLPASRSRWTSAGRRGEAACLSSGTQSLLEHAPRRGGVGAGELAGEVGLRVRDRRDPVDVAVLADLLLIVGDRVQRLLVDVEIDVARLLARL